MKTLIATFVFSLLLTSFPVTAQEKYDASPEAEAFYSSAMSQINAKHIRWIRSTAAETNEKNLSPDDVMVKTKAYALLGGMNGQEIEALCFLVLMQASKSTQEDLKAIIDQVKAINTQKRKLSGVASLLNDRNQSFTRFRLDSIKSISAQTQLLQRQNNPVILQPVRTTGQDSIKTVRVTRVVSQEEINTTRDKIKGDLDSMSEMGEMESLKLQMAMDRMSKMMSTLSNLLKKIHDTSQSIIQNLK
ncbi:MAG TPA: hypothetical protein VN451_02215 [Chitinophagaceae bacterium]|nr:hypothetical protein [Chitinophagaceae bacterium]